MQSCRLTIATTFLSLLASAPVDAQDSLRPRDSASFVEPQGTAGLPAPISHKWLGTPAPTTPSSQQLGPATTGTSPQEPPNRSRALFARRVNGLPEVIDLPRNSLPQPSRSEPAEIPAPSQPVTPRPSRLPPLDSPTTWWQPTIATHQFNPQKPTAIALEALIPIALTYSKQVRVARLQPFIEQEQITQTDARFDWTLFAQQLWIDTDEPTSSQLDAGENTNRLLQEDFNIDVGVRQTNRIGGQFEVQQNVQFLSSNSQFFNPKEQGISRLTLRYNQPLLRDGGRLVNEGQVILAKLNTEAVTADSEADIREVLLRVVEAYWEIYRSRASYVIQHKLVRSSEQLLADLRRRRRIDAQRSLIAQIESQLATQRADLVSARAAVLRAQHALVREIGDRNLDSYDELVPTATPFVVPIDWDTPTAFATALQNRAELRAAFKRIQGSELSRSIARHQLLPQLALIMEANVAAINGKFDVPNSLQDQFSEQAPTYTVGLSFEYPFGNRAAQSRVRETRLILARESASFEDAVDQIRQEVRDAVVSLRGLSKQVSAREQAVAKANAEIRALNIRRRVYPEEFDQISQLYLREFSEALQRRATAELALASSHVDYSIAIVRMRRAVGTLLLSVD